MHDVRLRAGFLYQPGDYEAATAYVRKLVEDATLRAQMGREARLEVLILAIVLRIWQRSSLLECATAQVSYAQHNANGLTLDHAAVFMQPAC
jgi:hypothetical protein